MFNRRKLDSKKTSESKTRHVLKTISWRVFGTINTILLSWYLFDDWSVGLQIGLIELISKSVLYYLHERTWYPYNFGLDNKGKPTMNRHIAKAVTWRIVGTIDTFVVSYILTGNLKFGLTLGVFEVISKFILYAVHEKAWSAVHLNKKIKA